MFDMRPLVLIAGLSVAACSQPEPAADQDAEMPPAETATAEAPVTEIPASEPVADAEPASTPAEIEITEWPVPWEGRPRDPYTTDGQTVWFVGQVNSYIASLDVASGEMTRIDLREGAGPHNLIVEPGGDVWYAGNRDGHIGLYAVDSATFDYVDTPRETAADPHTLIFNADGDIWFTSQRANSIGFMDVETRELTILPVATPSARPYGIRMAPDGRIWVALFGTNKLAVVDPQSLQVTEFDLPRETARPRRLDVTSDGRVWYGDYSDGYLGALDPATGEITEWPMPSGDSARPYALIADDSDRVWFVETGTSPNYFVGFDTRSEEIVSVTPIPSGGGVIRHMQFLADTQEIWFGTDAGTIGRASLGD